MSGVPNAEVLVTRMYITNQTGGLIVQ